MIDAKKIRKIRRVSVEPTALCVSLSNSNYFATKMEMKGLIRSPFIKNNDAVVKIVNNKLKYRKIANSFLNTVMRNNNNNLTQPVYRLNQVLDRPNFSYLYTRYGIFSIYIDRIHKELLVNSNDEIVKNFKNEIDKNNYNHEWKPMSFYDKRNQIKKEIQVLKYYLNSHDTPIKDKNTLIRYIEDLQIDLNDENKKLLTGKITGKDKDDEFTVIYEDKLDLSEALKPVDWSDKINVNVALLQDLENKGILNKFIGEETLRNNNIFPAKIEQSDFIESGTNKNKISSKNNTSNIDNQFLYKNKIVLDKSIESDTKSKRKKIKNGNKKWFY